jgi:deoxyribodipyrimidine photo-lyase
MAGGVHVVWFKRDLRLHDHAALCMALAAGRPLVLLHAFEPELLAAPEADRGHHGFVLDALAELDRGARARGGHLTVRRGDFPGVLERLQAELAPGRHIAAVFSHEETGNAITFARDRRVAAWLRERGIPWLETPQHGVVRRLSARDGWSRRWQERMATPPLPAPSRLDCVPPAALPPGDLPTPDERGLDALGLPPTTIVARQRGGEALARATLHSFLHERGADYQRAMSSPLGGWDACSRLSPHLAVGTVSLRTVHHELHARQAELRAMSPSERGTWGLAMRSFGSRLRWHCHFMQKLEDEPRIEFESMNRALDGLRGDADEVRLAAFQEGRTGYPMVDAVMRCLRHTGWMNFRMRAMLVSFAAYHLWLPWRAIGLWLARLFVDFEPGIHWSQVQMQSGVTGINAVRIYSPKKQLLDHDPEGVFVRRWLPELRGLPEDLPAELLAEPFRLSTDEQRRAHCRIGVDYPAPLVGHDDAVRLAKQRIHAARRSAEARRESARVYQEHGSRRRPSSRGATRAVRRKEQTP